VAWGTSTGTVAGASAFASSASYTSGAITCPIGDQIFLWVAFDNLTLTTPTISSITKAGGESASWVQIVAGDSPISGAAGGTRGELWAITPTVTWTAFSPVVTLSGAVTAKASVGICKSGGTLNARETLPKAGTNTTSVSPSVNTTTPLSGDLVLGVMSKEFTTGGVTADADTTNGSWSAGIEAATSNGAATDALAFLQWKITTGAGTQTFNPTTVSGTGDGTIAVIALAPASDPTTAQVSRVHEEVLLLNPAPDVRVSRVHEEVLLLNPAPDVRVSRVHVEVLYLPGTQSGDAALTTTATLTAAATTVQGAAAALSATATLTADGTRDQPGAAALSTTSTLTAAADTQGAATLSTTSTLAADGTRDQQGAVALVTVSTITAIPDGEVIASVDLVATSTLVAAASTETFGTATLVATSTLTPTAVRQPEGAAAFTATSTLTVTAVRQPQGVASLTTTSTLTATGFVPVLGMAALVTTSTLTAAWSAPVLVISGGTTTITVVSIGGDYPTTETMELVITDPDQFRAPTSVQVLLNGAESGEQIDFTIDSRTEIIWTVDTDSNGALFLSSVGIPGAIGDPTTTGVYLDAGTHTLHATSASGKTASDTFTLTRSPSPFPAVQSADVDPVGDPWPRQQLGAAGRQARRPRLVDHEPVSDHDERAGADQDRRRGPHDQPDRRPVPHLGRRGHRSKPWTWTGYCPDQTFYETLLAYSELNRRIYVHRPPRPGLEGHHRQVRPQAAQAAGRGRRHRSGLGGRLHRHRHHL
jgi:hypothetical protein